MKALTLDALDLARGALLGALWLLFAATLRALSAQAPGLLLVATTAYAVLLGGIWLVRDASPRWAGRLVGLAGALAVLWLLIAAITL